MSQPQRSANFSRCGQYRYQLRRRWLDGHGCCVFIGLNPSIADAQADDPTIRRCMGYARDWGYQELVVINLFAYRTPHPTELKRSSDPVGPGNRRHIRAACKSADLIVAAWGTNGVFRNQAQKMSRLWDGSDVFCFSLTKNRQPAHPLYQRRDAKLLRFRL